MHLVILVAAGVAGLVAVGLLMLLEAILRSFLPTFALPFSAWWGLLLTVPGVAGTLLLRRI